MKDLVQTIVKSLVDDESAVEVTQLDGVNSSIIEVKVTQDDVGKIIGKQGNTARSIRTILKAAGKKNNRVYKFEII